MADFNAGESVPVVHYNFAPYVEWSGEITEPSFAMLNDFRRSVGALLNKASEGAPDTDIAALSLKEQLGLIAKMLNVDNSSDQETVVSMVVTLTELDRSKFETVPWRIQQAFLGHLVQEYLRPEAPGTIATS